MRSSASILLILAVSCAFLTIDGCVTKLFKKDPPKEIPTRVVETKEVTFEPVADSTIEKNPDGTYQCPMPEREDFCVHGTCYTLASDMDDYLCKCDPGYSGIVCNLFQINATVDEISAFVKTSMENVGANGCPPILKSYCIHGECVSTPGKGTMFSCKCRDGYFGARCDSDNPNDRNPFANKRYRRDLPRVENKAAVNPKFRAAADDE